MPGLHSRRDSPRRDENESVNGTFVSSVMPAVHSRRENPRQYESENVDGSTRLTRMLPYSLGCSCLARYLSLF